MWVSSNRILDMILKYCYSHSDNSDSNSHSDNSDFNSHSHNDNSRCISNHLSQVNNK